ncbi:hypothetical protein [Streptomyces anulatus]|uniref:hypothetical protein n=1 Tax=Streptomyces anulatus TaxID=1892 RepID=UPI0004C782AE|nr:hypothetical protein [Streptomyces anulatus]
MRIIKALVLCPAVAGVAVFALPLMASAPQPAPAPVSVHVLADGIDSEQPSAAVLLEWNSRG